MSPGERFQLNITALDQINNSVFSIPLVRNIAQYNQSKNGKELKKHVFSLKHVVLTPGENQTEVRFVPRLPFLHLSRT